MKVRDLKLILADMSDDAEVLARGKDCINLDMVDVVGHPSPIKMRRVNYHDTIDQVYGGGDSEIETEQAIIFCEMD